MADTISITADEVRTLLECIPESGSLVWRHRDAGLFEDGGHGAAHNCAKWNARWAGRQAGTVNNKGYLVVSIFPRLYLAHRLIWLVAYGRWPAAQIDHLNGDRTDNSLANLREATQSQNNQNRPGVSARGFLGVSWDKTRQKWTARIQILGKQKNLGRFSSRDEAHAAYLVAKQRTHPFNPVPRGLEAADNG